MPQPDETPSDPETDVVGWESGYWYNESVVVTPDDGLNRTELNSLLQRTIARVEHLRRTEFEDPIILERQSRDQYKRLLERREKASPTVRAFENTQYEASFLVGEDTDAVNLTTQSSVAGIRAYASGNRIVVVTDNEEFGSSGPVNVSEMLLAHELTHVLQFQEGRLTPLVEPTTQDSRLVRQSLVEGEAVSLASEYARQCGEAWDCVGSNVDSESDDNTVHPGLVKQSQFRYVAGHGFVRYLQREGGWSTVDAAFEQPPRSTEQIAFPETYLDDNPSTITMPSSIGDNWERVHRNESPDYETLGAARISVMFMYPALDGRPGDVVPKSSFQTEGADGLNASFHYRIGYARGWDGDKLAIYRNADGQTAYVWRLAWDSTEDANEFVQGYRELLQYWGGERVGDGSWRISEGTSPFADAFYVHVDESIVTIVNHPNGSCLDVVLDNYSPCDDGG